MLPDVRQVLRRVHRELLAVRLEDVVLHRRRGREQVEVELALEPLLDDLHVQQAEEPDAEAEAERVATTRARR